MSIFSRLRRRGDEGSRRVPAERAAERACAESFIRITGPAAGPRARTGEATREVGGVAPAAPVACARAGAPARVERAAARQRSDSRSPVRSRRPAPLAPSRAPNGKVPASPAAKASPFPAATPVAARDGRARVAGRGGGAGGRLAGPGDRARAREQRRGRKARGRPGAGAWPVDRVRRGRPARDVRGAGGLARDADPQRDDGGPLGRGAGELARARASRAEVAAHDGVGGRPRRAGRRRSTVSSARCRRCSSRDSPPEVTGPSRETLLAAYAPLATCLPRAFELEGERDRREPIVVRALLEQVAGLEPLMIDKMMAAGLGTLAPLFAARADEIAAVTGHPRRDRRRGGRAHPGVPSRRRRRRWRPSIRRRRSASSAKLRRAAARRARRVRGGGARLVARRIAQAKKQLRQRRQTTFLQITIALVRLGEIDVALRLPKLPFARRIDELDRIVASRAAAIRATRPRGERQHRREPRESPAAQRPPVAA